MTDTTTLSTWGDAETKYFYELTPDKILDSVETFGFRCTGRCFALNSMENRVYEVEVEPEDEQLAVKNPSERFRIIKFYRPGRWTKEQILEEHRFLLDLAERDIPAVAPLTFTGGETVLTLPESGILCAVFPRIGGRSPDELPDNDLQIVGRLLARLHNVGQIRDAANRIKIDPNTYGLQSLSFLRSSGVLPPSIEGRYASAVEEICDIAAPWFETTPIQRVHGDCHLGNLLHGRDGFFWVDFDDMLRGPCVQDLWLIVGGRDEYAMRKLDLLLEAYEQMREFDRRTLRLIEPLRSLRMIHFNAWIAKRWEDPAFPRTFVTFGTERYWQEQLLAIEEQRELVRQLRTS